MGGLVESCKQHMECCNTEDKRIMTEPNSNSKISLTDTEEESSLSETEEKINNEIPNDV
jgi:hypothetical protein